MKIATWNVNGIRAREAQLCDWVERDRPDDIETRIVQLALGNLVLASVYVPNGGKDYGAKLRFLQGLVDWVRTLHAEVRELILCGDINIARADVDVHPRERKPGIVGQREEERTCSRRCSAAPG